MYENSLLKKSIEKIVSKDAKQVTGSKTQKAIYMGNLEDKCDTKMVSLSLKITRGAKQMTS